MNMSYCRWHNTLTDLRDCAGDLEERMSDHEASEPLSADERRAMIQVLELAAEMLGQVGVSVEGDVATELQSALKDVK